MEISTTEWTKLKKDMYPALDCSYWLAMRSGEVMACHRYFGGRFVSERASIPCKDVTHIMRLVVPKHPSES